MSLVTVICLCYNQARFVAEAVESVVSQSYPDIELIIVDDKSKDSSSESIFRLCEKYPHIKFIQNEANLGMCKSFNKALALSKGSFIINLAADDVLMPEMIERQVKVFETLNDSWGVIFSDSYTINEKGETRGTFYRRSSRMELLEEVISGDIFTKVVQRYRICSSTLMVRKEVLVELGGYDESLSYEDYDFHIRASRKYKYYFLNEILTGKRTVKGADSSSWYKKGHNPHLTSTLRILKKYIWLSDGEEEKTAALSSIRYHMRQSLFMECFALTQDYYKLIKNLKKVSSLDHLIYFLSLIKIPFHNLFKVYLYLSSPGANRKF